MRSFRPLPTFAATLLTIAAALTFGSGCSDSDGGTNPDPSSQEEDSTVPTLAEVESEVAMTPQQAAEVEQALAEWRTAASRVENLDDVLLEDAPAVAFLARSAATLDANQMRALRRMAVRSVDALADGLRPDPGAPHVGLVSGIRGLFHGLDLSREQITALRDALAATREEVVALCDDYRDGLITVEELRTAREQLRLELQATIATILTAEQNAEFEANKLEILTRRITHLLERFDVRVDRRLAHLDALLDLSAEQETAIVAVLEAAEPDVEALLSDLEAGVYTSAEAWAAFRALQEETATLVRAELTVEQVAILDELRAMHEPCRANVEI